MEDELTIPYGRESQSPRRRRLTRFGKWFGLIVGSLLLLAFVAHAVWLGASARRLNRLLAGLNAAGEPTTLAALAPPAVPTTQNGYDDLLAAGERIDVDTVAAKRRDQIEPVPPLVAFERHRLAARVAETAVNLAEIEAALAKPLLVSTSPPLQPAAFLTPKLAGFRNTANLLTDAALLAHDAGHDGQALNRLVQTGQVADALRESHTLVHALVATGIRAMQTNRLMAIAPTLRIADTADAATPANVRATIDALLDGHAIRAEYADALRGERVFMLGSMTALSNGTMGQPANGFSRRAYSAAARYVTGPMFNTNAVVAAERLAVTIAAAGEPDWPATKMKLGPPPPRPRGLGVLTGGLASLLTSSLDRSLEAPYRLVTDRALAAVALAARWYEIDHGRRPASLAALVPKYLPAVPLDPMSPGRPLCENLTDADPRVWSVGLNGIDNKGDDLLLGERVSWQGPDRVLHLLPGGRVFGPSMKQLIALDLDTPVRQTAEPAPPLAGKAVTANGPPTFPNWEEATAFEVAGDAASFGYTERRDAFAAVFDSAPVDPAAVPTQPVTPQPATSPAVRLWGRFQFGQDEWRFELSPDGSGVVLTPAGVLVPIHRLPGPANNGGDEFWR